jgi:hypothetical protein
LEEDAVQSLRHVGHGVVGPGVQTGSRREAAQLESPRAIGRINFHARDAVGCRGRNILDVDAAHRAGDHHGTLRRAVDHDAQVVLGGDVERLFDQHVLDE